MENKFIDENECNTRNAEEANETFEEESLPVSDMVY
jgi:hypothetical protein